MRRTARLLAPVSVALLATIPLAACSSGDDGDSVSPETRERVGESTTTIATETGCTTSETGPLDIVLVNDDGIINPAIDVLIEALDGLEDIEVEVTVVAPADEKSGSSDTTTPGGATYSETASPGGNPGYAVDGFPADAVIVALDDLGLEPDLVLSGINPGQNIGPFASISGTVGVGRTAIRRGVPALAVSGPPELVAEQFDVGAELALEWIEENCEALVAGTAQTDTVTSINFPACAPEQMGELQAVPRAAEFPEGANPFASSCDLSNPAPATDYEALIVGYPSITQVPADI